MPDTSHQLYQCDARSTPFLADESVELIVTSPPYPMVAMWDTLFAQANPAISEALNESEAGLAFQLMHEVLDPIWEECCRVLAPGGIACINIGDATRTLGGQFALHANHARIISAFRRKPMQCLPLILWRKTTNAPNKFMGSGMLAPGAYVTLEHEYILIFRKGGKRLFKEGEKANRQTSAFFWEERNQWFSDTWQLHGERQKLDDGLDRERSAAYVFELPYRLINMFSVKGDRVYDPFAGTGTTTLAALASGRSSVGVDLSKDLLQVAADRINQTDLMAFLNGQLDQRLSSHRRFVKERITQKGAESVKHTNIYYDLPVMTRQEVRLYFNKLLSIKQEDSLSWSATYEPLPG